MNKNIGIIISLIASLSTLLGYFFIYIKGDKNKIISSSLAFAGGVMITLSILDLIPSSILYFYKVNNKIMSILHSFTFVVLGIAFCHYIHISLNISNKLYKTGIMSIIGVLIHNIPEGIMTFALSSIDLKIGLFFAITIIMHNIPEGICISIPIYYSTKNKFKAFIYTLVSGLGELIGAVLCMVFLYKFLNNIYIAIIYSIIAGFMIYIGYFEMIKESLKYEKSVKNFTLLGVLFVLVLEIIINL